MGFSRQEHWNGLPCPPPGDLPNTGIEPRSLALKADSLPSEPTGKPKKDHITYKVYHIGYLVCYWWCSDPRLSYWMHASSLVSDSTCRVILSPLLSSSGPDSASCVISLLPSYTACVDRLVRWEVSCFSGNLLKTKFVVWRKAGQINPFRSPVPVLSPNIPSSRKLSLLPLPLTCQNLPL